LTAEEMTDQMRRKSLSNRQSSPEENTGVLLSQSFGESPQTFISTKAELSTKRELKQWDLHKL
jgi:hypothetical protein